MEKKPAYLGTDLWYRLQKANSCLQLCPLMDSITVHDLEFEWENYSNFENINAALNSYALVKWHPVNTHGGSAKNTVRAQFGREAQPCRDPSGHSLSESDPVSFA